MELLDFREGKRKVDLNARLIFYEEKEITQRKEFFDCFSLKHLELMEISMLDFDAADNSRMEVEVAVETQIPKDRGTGVEIKGKMDVMSALQLLECFSNREINLTHDLSPERKWDNKLVVFPIYFSFSYRVFADNVDLDTKAVHCGGEIHLIMARILYVHSLVFLFFYIVLSTFQVFAVRLFTASYLLDW
ncbi:hypothetical protein M9H77_14768 [Catharanthus roseus]|uniref:Uncharacterized protein n=1 Tax=Catharanthus roseus TaxID=4058 RepID=A0ACC0BNY6_CATRO|nr:hypothetical protein M9H77_14768 [Catharanthus roseus]